MLDRVLAYTLHLTIVGLICALRLTSMFSGYHGLLTTIGERPAAGGGWVVLALGMGMFTYQLCKYRNDLVDQ